MTIGDIFFAAHLEAAGLQREAQVAGQKAGETLGKQASAGLATGLAGAGRSLTKFGDQARNAGSALSIGLTLPILGVGAAVVAVSRDFDTSLRRIVGLTGVTADEIDGIRTAILALSREVGKTPVELADGFYFLASAGFNGKEALEVLEVSAKAAASGLGQTSDIAQVVGAAINAFGRENLTASDAVDTLIRAIGEGTAEAPEFANSLGSVIGSAAQVGATFNEVTAAIAAMTIKGINASEAAVALNQVFVSLFKPTRQAQEALENAGLSAAGLREQIKEKGLLSVLQLLADRLGGNEEAIAAVFGNVRALKAILALTSGDLRLTEELFGRVEDRAGALAQAFADTEGPARDMDRAMSDIQASLIEIGEDVLPIAVELLKDMAVVVHGLVGVFKGLPKPVRDVVVVALALAAALGPLLYIGGTLVGSIGRVITAFGGLGRVVAGAVSGLADKAGVKAAATRAGTAIGMRIGAGMAAGIAASAAIVAAGIIVTIAEAEKAAAENEAALKTGTLDDLLETRIEAAGLRGRQLIDKEGRLMQAGARQAAEGVTSELAEVGTETPYSLGVSLAAGEDRVTAGAEAMMAGLVPSVEDAAEGAGAAAARTPGEIAAGLRDKRNVVQRAVDQLKEDIKNRMSATAEVAYLVGVLTSKEVARGLKSSDPVVRAQAEETRRLAEERLAELRPRAGIIGKKTNEELARGLKSKDQAVIEQAKRTRGLLETNLKPTTTPANAGRDAGAFYAKAIIAAALAWKARIRSALGGLFPTSVDASFTYHAKRRQYGGPVQAGQPYIVGESGRELFVPDTAGRIIPEVSTTVGQTAPSSIINNYNVAVEGLLRARDPFEVAAQLRRLGEFGVLTPRREMAGG